MPLELLISVPIALVLLVWLKQRGMLSEKAFEDAPPREAGFNGADLLVGVMIFLVANAIAPFALMLLGLMGDDLTSSQQVVRVVAAQALTQLPLVVYVIVRASWQPDGLREAGLLPRRPIREIATGLFSLLVALPLVVMLSSLILWLSELADVPKPEAGHDLLQLAQSLQSTWAIALLGFSAVVAAPVLEEIIFRGLLQSSLLGVFGRQWRWLVIVMASVLFVSVHVSVAWQVLPALFVLSLVLGWLYERTGSLWPPIVLHASFNALNLGVTLMGPG